MVALSLFLSSLGPRLHPACLRSSPHVSDPVHTSYTLPYLSGARAVRPESHLPHPLRPCPAFFRSRELPSIRIPHSTISPPSPPSLILRPSLYPLHPSPPLVSWLRLLIALASLSLLSPPFFPALCASLPSFLLPVTASNPIISSPNTSQGPRRH
ncbi:hypothetical protein B0H15DRAFT_843794 [Mycena belliarum]|uniref:Uncharacterized protein n=1 Tax=Mycena belliarum TaxID=1033014 RepID=A0AAD6XR66_9AGAR|nr:hypothetical protein B0H15DRAFT_843794 [Mycena belliae]